MLSSVSLRVGLAAVWCLPILGSSQTLSISNGVHTYSALTNTTVMMTGRCELRLNIASNALQNSIVHLNSPDAWLLFANLRPSQVTATQLGSLRVNGANAVSGGNVRVDEFGPGTVVIPHPATYRPLQVFSTPHFLGLSTNLGLYTYHTNALLGAFDTAIRSFRLKRGYMATFAQTESGGGASRVFVAQDGDLDVGMLAPNLDRAARFVRVFPWRWASKKGWAGGVQPLVNPHWSYDWDNVATSTPDAEYVPMRHNLNWNAYGNINSKQRSTHALGFNEPDQENQANMSVATAIAAWPNLVRSGLRLGAPAVSDSGVAGQGLSWLYSFMDEADALGYRVDFIPVHFYKCDWNATQYYNWLLGIYERTGRPIWVTEFNNGANWCSGTPTLSQNATQITQFLEMLENAPFVERYAIYNWVGATRAMVADDGSLTPAGLVYRERQSRPGYTQTVPASGNRSVAQYHFETNALDGSGFANNGLVIGAPTYTTGHVGQALQFDGVNHHVRLPPNIANSSAFSFAAWIQWDGGANWQRIFDFGNDTSHYLFLTPSSGSSTLRFAIRNGGSEQIVQTTTALAIGQWQHVTVTLGGNTIRLYTNGLLAAFSTNISIAPANFNPSLNYLGESQFTADPLFRGRLDEVLITDYVLSAAQVSALQTNRAPHFDSSTIVRSNAVPGQSYSGSLAAEAVDPNPGDVLTFTKLDGPAWLTVSANGSFSGTPGPRQSGANHFVVRVTDFAGASAFALLAIQVDPPPGVAITPTLIPAGSAWRYFDKTNDLGTSWRTSAFNDTGWSNGRARLGYGNDGEITTVSSNRQWTTYFRRQFYIDNPGQVLALKSRITRDDAAIVYLNFAEVWRDPNMPSGAITYLTPALSALGGADETNWLSAELDPARLIAGWNTLAVEVHNQSLTSTDLGFDFELTAEALIDEIPRLAATASTAGLTLSGPAKASYFSVYSASNLTPPAVWTRLTNSSVFANGSWSIFLSPITNGNRFFRLQLP